MENTRKKLCERILVWNAQKGLKHMLIIKLSYENHFEISTRNYARNERAARAVIRSKLAGSYYLSSYRLPIKIDRSLWR